MGFFYFFALMLFIALCGVLCLVILVQESKSLGLGASFGGEPAESFFGTSTAEVLKKFTAWLAVAFMVGCIVLSLWSSIIGKASHALPQVVEQAVP